MLSGVGSIGSNGTRHCAQILRFLDSDINVLKIVFSCYSIRRTAALLCFYIIEEGVGVVKEVAVDVFFQTNFLQKSLGEHRRKPEGDLSAEVINNRDNPFTNISSNICS